MSLIASLLPLGFFVALTAVIIFTIRGPLRRIEMDASQADSARAAALRVRIRNYSALVAATAAGTAVAWLGYSTATDLGRLLLLTPIITAGVAVVVFALVPTAPFRESSASRRADLSRRTPWTFAAGRAFVAPGLASAVLVAVTVTTAWIAEPDGRSIRHSNGAVANAAYPYPGAFYVVPLLVAVALLIAVAMTALWRISSAPRPSAESLRDTDSTLRMLGARVVTKSVTSAFSVTLGIVLLLAGDSTRRVASGSRAMIENMDVSAPPDVALIALGICQILLGVGALAFGVVVLLSAVRDAIRPPFEVALAEGQPA